MSKNERTDFRKLDLEIYNFLVINQTLKNNGITTNEEIMKRFNIHKREIRITMNVLRLYYRAVADGRRMIKHFAGQVPGGFRVGRSIAEDNHLIKTTAKLTEAPAITMLTKANVMLENKTWGGKVGETVEQVLPKNNI